MKNNKWAYCLCLWTTFLASSGECSPGAADPMDLITLARLAPAELEALYARSSPGAIPKGRVRGLALVRPGTRLAPALSRGSRVAWQGKVFDPSGASSINRFFGVKAVRADVSYGPSWRDGHPAIILDYGRTSTIYAPYRDELREVAPGLYLGLMFDRRKSPPGLKMYFAIRAAR